MESSAKHFFHMGKKFAGGSGAALSILEPSNRMSPVPADEMLTIDEDFALREFTCKWSFSILMVLNE